VNDLVDRLKKNHAPNSVEWEAAIEIERLREGPCKFNCRKGKGAYLAGWADCIDSLQELPWQDLPTDFNKLERKTAKGCFDMWKESVK